MHSVSTGMDCKPVLVPLEHLGKPTDTKEDPEQLHTLSSSMGTTFGNSCHGMRSHHTFIYMEGTQPYPHGLQSCPEKNAVEKPKRNISFSVLECGCLLKYFSSVS